MSIRRREYISFKCSAILITYAATESQRERSFSVGRAQSPTTVAPALITVPTIFFAESMTAWSYDFGRMRIFCPAIGFQPLF